MKTNNFKDVKVSIVIPTRNRCYDLIKCLDSLNLQTYKNFEIIIIDNNSQDETVKKLKNKYPSVSIFLNRKNLGPSQARNQGIRIATGKYIWFLDSDSIVPKENCLGSMVKLMEEFPIIGSIGGELFRNKKGNSFLKVKRLCINGSTKTSFFQPDKARLIKCDYLATCNCFVRKSILYKIGGFDPHYFCFSEDAELGLKIVKEGFLNICDIRTSVIHNINPLERRNLFLKFRNNIRLAIKNFSFFRIVLLPFSIIILKFRMNFFRRFKEEDPSLLKYLKNKRSLSSMILFLLKSFYSLFFAYVWNIIYSPITVYYRFKNENYLENAPQPIRYEE